MQRVVDDFVKYWNTFKVRRQDEKLLLSGCTRNDVFCRPAAYGYQDCGAQIPPADINVLRAELPRSREECFRFVSPQFERDAWKVYQELGFPKLTIQSGWKVFTQMLPVLAGIYYG